MQGQIQGVQWVQLHPHPRDLEKNVKIPKKIFTFLYYFLYTLVSLIHHHSKHIGCKIKAEPGPWEGCNYFFIIMPKHIGCKIKDEPGPWEGRGGAINSSSFQAYRVQNKS